MKYLFLLLTIILVVPCSGQEMPPFELKAGVYKTAQDVIANNPMAYDKLDILKHEQSEKGKNRSYNIPSFRLDLSEEESDALGRIFGFSDGEALYLNNYGPTDNGATWFYKAEVIGHFIYYDTVERGNYGLYVKTCVLDRKNRVFYRGLLNKDVKKILSDKPVLKKKFIKQKDKSLYHKDYLIEYSNTN